MKAMILAAGEGRRMLPLTATTPKPLLPLGDTTLIGYHLRRLQAAGFEEVVINVAYLGAQIQQALGNGSQLGLRLRYSVEPFPLETGGGISRALDLLGEAPFALINGDVFSDFPLAQLRKTPHGLGHLVLVTNPSHHPRGDFGLASNGLLQPPGQVNFTYSGLAVLHPALLYTYPLKREKFGLLEVFNWAIARNQLHGSVYSGQWLDVGTPERLETCRVLYRHIQHTAPRALP